MTAALVAPGTAYLRVLAAFEAHGPIKMRGNHAFMTSCPLHEDHTPSVSVRWKPARTGDTGGAVFLKCFSCDAAADHIAAAIGLTLADLFDNPLEHPTQILRPRTPRPNTPPAPKTRPAPKPATAHHWKTVHVYTYTRADGSPVQQVLRQQCTCGDRGPHKRFVQRYRHGRTWQWEAPDQFTPALYRAPQLANAEPQQWIWLTEGEKDADTAARCGQISTTNAGGAAGFPAALFDQFTGRRVAILIDRDPAGYRRGLDLHRQLADIAADIVILLADIDTPKADLTDHVEAKKWNPDTEFGGLIVLSADELAAWAATTENHQ